MKKILAIMLTVCMLVSGMAVFAVEGEAVAEEEVVLISAPAEDGAAEAAKGEEAKEEDEASEEAVEINFETVEKHAILIDGEKIAIVGGMGTIVQENGVVFVPVRALLEAVGYQVSWASKERMVMGANAMSGAMFIIQLDNALLFFTDGKTDGKLTMEAAPFMNCEEYRTYVPLNDAAEALGYKVSYDAEANAIALSK